MAIAEAISEVEDEETQTTLSDLLSAYQEALDAEKEALDNAAGKEEDIDIESLRNAVKEARDELTSALEEAGVEIELPERLEAPNGERPELTDEERENLPELSDGQRRAGKGDNAQITDGQENGTGSAQGSTEGKQGKTGFFSKIKNAVSNFFGGFKK